MEKSWLTFTMFHFLRKNKFIKILKDYRMADMACFADVADPTTEAVKLRVKKISKWTNTCNDHDYIIEINRRNNAAVSVLMS